MVLECPSVKDDRFGMHKNIGVVRIIIMGYHSTQMQNYFLKYLLLSTFLVLLVLL